MVRVSTFCPRCGESIETEVPDEAKTTGRAELACPACRFEFVIAPARQADRPGGVMTVPPTGTPRGEAGVPVRATSAERAAPAHGGRPASAKPLAAGLMLLFVALIGLWTGFSLVLSEDITREAFAELEGEGILTGIVTDGAGGPLEGVQVEMTTRADGSTIDPLDRPNATTDASGRYRFEGIEPGVHRFEFRLENHTTVILETPAYPSDYAGFLGDVYGDVTMPEGDPTETEVVSRVDMLETVVRVWGWFTIAASALAAAGGWACLRRRGFALALIGAIAGIFTFGLVIGSIVALIALVLVLLSRKEFEPLRRPKAEGR